MLLSDLLLQKEKINQVTDFNAIGANGMKRGTDATNAPGTGPWFVQTMIQDSSAAVQKAYGYEANKGIEASRVKSQGVWGGWTTGGQGGGDSASLEQLHAISLSF